MSRHIGVFGDSFATVKDIEPNGEWRDHLLAWPKLLETVYNYKVSFFAKPCTSIYWSFLKFIEHKNNFDTIIFTVTDPNRLHNSNDALRIGNASTVEMQLKKINSFNPLYKFYAAANDYYKYLIEPDFCAYVHNKICEDVVQICTQENKELIVVPVCPITRKYAKFFIDSLGTISYKELRTQFNDDIYRMETQNRACHMSAENNKRLAKSIHDILQGKDVKIDIDCFEFKKVTDPENYWELK